MVEIKAYTDLEQSKKLAEILPIESADMHYHYDFDFDELESIPTITEEDDHFILFPKDVRCWSLTALLSVIPKDEYKDVDLCFGGYQGDKYIDEWFCSYEQHNHPFLIETCHAPTPVDDCYELILKLHGLN